MSSEVRRDAILTAAARLFRHYGHAKTTMADIAREARIGVGSVYLEFASKELIVEELSLSIHERVLAAMRRAATAGLADSFNARLVGVLEARLLTFLRLREEGQHACELVHCKAEAVKSASARFRDEERALLRQLLEQARERRELAVDVDPRSAAALIQRAYATLSPPWLFDMAHEEAQRTTYEMAHLLLVGMVPRRDPHEEDEEAAVVAERGGRAATSGTGHGAGARRTRRR